MAKQKTVEKVQESAQKPVRTIRSAAPFEVFDRFFENMPRGFGRQFRGDWPNMAEMMQPLEARIPNVDIVDRESELLVRAELPGIDKKDIDISVTSDAVTIKGTTKEEHKEEKDDYYRCEISQGAFSRTLPLPCAVNSDAAKATFKDGLLELTLPKETATPKRTVQID